MRLYKHVNDTVVNGIEREWIFVLASLDKLRLRQPSLSRVKPGRCIWNTSLVRVAARVQNSELFNCTVEKVFFFFFCVACLQCSRYGWKTAQFFDVWKNTRVARLKCMSNCFRRYSRLKPKFYLFLYSAVVRALLRTNSPHARWRWTKELQDLSVRVQFTPRYSFFGLFDQPQTRFFCCKHRRSRG